MSIADAFLKMNCTASLGVPVPGVGVASLTAASAGSFFVVKQHFANSLFVQVTPTYGSLRVVNSLTGKPIAGAYVKAYSRNKDGSVSFYKDCYTAANGRADYASLSTAKLGSVAQFSLLVLHPEFGAVVKTAEPPQQ